jgi:hypothetical protein
MAALSLDDARLAIARYYDFLDWFSLAAHVEAVAQLGPVCEFESAVETVVNGDLVALDDALRRDPALVRARSSRVCCFDPSVHRATLLHYVAANGVERYRQKTPPTLSRSRTRYCRPVLSPTPSPTCTASRAPP